MLSTSVTILITASSSCWPLTTALPSCLVKNTVTEAILLGCFLNRLPSPPWQACSLTVVQHRRFHLLVLARRRLHIYVSPLSLIHGGPFQPLPFCDSVCRCLTLSFALPATQAWRCAFSFSAWASLHILPQLTHTLIHTGKLPASGGQAYWKLLICTFENYSKGLAGTQR